MRWLGKHCGLFALALLGLGCMVDPEVFPEDGLDASSSPVDFAHSHPDATYQRRDAAGDALDASGPPYPIILVHGMGGFSSIGSVEYFYGVEEALRKDGHDVWTSQQDPMNSTYIRGPQLLAYVEMVLEVTGKAKVNLVAHSQGGLDSQYVASQMGPRVASVTTIATPFHGTPIIDVALGVLPGPAQSVLEYLLDFWGAPGGYDSSTRACVEMLSTPGVKAFLAQYPDHPQVDYFSIAGRSNMVEHDVECDTFTPAPFVTKWDDQRDPINSALAPAAAINALIRPGAANDGFVLVSSSHHGTFLGCIPADHADEIGQFLGESPGSGNGFDYLRFYRELASWLVARGY